MPPGAASNDESVYTRSIVLSICESASIDVSHSTHHSGQRIQLWPTRTATASVMVVAPDEARLRLSENGKHLSGRSPCILLLPSLALYAAALASSSMTMNKGILVPPSSARGVSMLDDRPPYGWHCSPYRILDTIWMFSDALAFRTKDFANLVPLDSCGLAGPLGPGAHWRIGATLFDWTTAWLL